MPRTLQRRDIGTSRSWPSGRVNTIFDWPVNSDDKSGRR